MMQNDAFNKGQSVSSIKPERSRYEKTRCRCHDFLHVYALLFE